MEKAERNYYQSLYKTAAADWLTTMKQKYSNNNIGPTEID